MRRAVALFVSVVAMAACETALAASSPAAKTVWLCRPGLAHNPCLADQTTSVVGRNGSVTVVRTAPAARPPVDCFYVYPTVSRQQTTNANLEIDPEERAVASAQASRFSSACRVYAPIYPQLTLQSVLTPGGITPAGAATAYLGVRPPSATTSSTTTRGAGSCSSGTLRARRC